jgi:hypothetical protein
MKTKVVYNSSFGGFHLSQTALDLYEELTGNSIDEYGDCCRHDAALVEVVETLGEDACASHADLRIAYVNEMYRVCEYDGSEWVETPESIEWVVV